MSARYHIKSTGFGPKNFLATWGWVTIIIMTTKSYGDGCLNLHTWKGIRIP